MGINNTEDLMGEIHLSIVSALVPIIEGWFQLFAPRLGGFTCEGGAFGFLPLTPPNNHAPPSPPVSYGDKW